MSKELWKAIQAHVGAVADGIPGDDTANRLATKLGLNSAAGGAHRIGPKGFALIKSFEGLRLQAYPDPATGGEPWTIGYGHTSGVKRGDVITEAVADAFLLTDLARFEKSVNRLFPTTTQNQFDALVSLCFNVGEGNLEGSTIRKKHNAGDYAGARGEFARWNKAAGKEMAGLTRRRAAEALLYGSFS